MASEKSCTNSWNKELLIIKIELFSQATFMRQVIFLILAGG